MKKSILFVCLLSMFYLVGCNSVPTNPIEDPLKPSALAVPYSELRNLTDRFNSNNVSIGELSKDASSKAEKIAIENPKIKEASVVKLAVDKIGLINTDNIKNTLGLSSVKDQLAKASVEVEELKATVEKYKNDLQNGMNKILLLVYSMCIIGIAAGVVLIFFNQHQNGMIAICISVTMLGLVYFLQLYAWILGIISGVFFLLLLVICGLKIYNDQKVKKELVQSYEKIKKATKYEDAERLAVTNIQSEATMAEVANIKKNLC